MSDFTPKTDTKPSATLQKSRNGSSSSEAEVAIQSKTTLEGTLSNWYKANSRPGIQAKLKVSEPDDPQEKEADRMALQVMAMPEPVAASTPPTARKEELQREEKEELQKQDENKEDIQLSTDKTEIVQRREEEEIQKQDDKDEKLDRNTEEKEEPIQKMDENEKVQAKQFDIASSGRDHGFAIQRKEEESEESKEVEVNRQGIIYTQSNSIQRSGRSPPAPTSTFSQSLDSSKGKGDSLPSDTRSFMESRFNADFTGVRIHTDESSVQMNKEVHAQAFTHGNDIYFNSGKYSPGSSEGRVLLAHELTHTIQQGASSQVTPSNPAVNQPVSNSPPLQAKQDAENEEETLQPKASLLKKVEPSVVPIQKSSSPAIQRGIFSSIAGAFSSAVEWVGDKLDDGKKWLLSKIQGLIVKVPGYKALCVALGKDPVTGDQVDRNGKNFIDAAIDIIPGGSLLKSKLTELGILDKAGQFIDTSIEKVKGLVSGIFTSFSTFWSGISLSDLKDVPGVFHRLENVFTSFINQIISFAIDVGKSFLDFIKKALLIPLGNYIKTKTKFWDLLCIIIGKDPLTDEPKVVNGTNILNAVLGLSEWGIEQRKKMQETDTFSKVAAWIDKGISVFSKSYDELKAALLGIWDYVKIESLMDPIGTFNKIFNSFWAPISRVASFTIETGVAILKIVKDVLFKWISTKAKDKKGYYLITVLIKKDPFTGEAVPRNTESIIKGFMMLTEGGEAQFNKMKESGAMDKATQKIDAAIATLGFTIDYVKGLFINLWNSFTWVDLVVPIMAFAKIIDTFAAPILRLINFVITVLMALFEVILRMMGFPVDMVFKLLANVQKAWNSIKANPSGFFINILKAIKQGFTQFFDNFLKHLVNGLIDWFFDQLKDVGVTRPPDFTLKSIINLVLQVLGISMEKIWEKLSIKIGAEKVAKIRGALDKLEGIWKFIKDVQERGMSAIWDYIKEQLSNLWTMVLEAATKWIMEKIITQVTVKLLSMLDPTGIMAVVNSCIAIYKAIESFIQYFTQMLGIINSFVEGIIEIAEGNIAKAANFLEKSMASAIPIVIGFLANQVGLGKIGKKIVEVIEKVQDVVDKALDWLIDKAVSLGTSFISTVKEGVAAVGAWWKSKAKFKDAENKEHNVLFEGEGETAVLSVRSEPQPYTKFLKNYEEQLTDDTKKPHIVKAKAKAKEIEDERVKPVAGANDAEKKKNQEAKDKLIEELIEELAQLSEPIFGAEKPQSWKVDPVGGGKNLFAASMVAERIYNNPKLVAEGSEPTSERHAIFDTLNVRQKGNGSYYIRGHLLNHNIGGPGKWTNMTALSRSGNHQHESTVECFVKAAFDAGAVIYYSVKADGNHSTTIPTESDKPKFTRIPDINKHFGTIKTLISEESKVCQELKCSAYTMKKNGENWEKDKKIVETDVPNVIEKDYSTYELEGSIPPPKVKLSTGENIDKLSEVIDYPENLRAAFISKLLTILKHKKDNTEASFGSYDTLAVYKILSADGKTVSMEFDSSEKAYILGKMKDNPNVVI